MLALCSAVTLTACGGGSSNSGGGPAPVAPPVFTLFATGIYSGVETGTTEGKNIVSNNDPNPIRLEVQGSVAGNQQVRVAYLQFSGTSSIGPDGQFSIPSGSFPIRVSDRNNRVISTCLGELLFEGTFAGNTVSGSVMTTSPFVCDDARFGPITYTSTFEATLGAAKLVFFEQELIVWALDY